MSSMEKGKDKIGSEEVEKQDSVVSLEFGIGDVIFAKLPNDSWWPGQIVADETVDASVKPADRSAEEDVLVRLYGSYTYLYVDPLRSFSAFGTMIKANKGDLRKVLQEALDKDLPSKQKKTRGTPSKSSASQKKPTTPTTGQVRGTKRQRQKQIKDGDLGSPSRETASGKPQELSSRRIRVMESLGLIAPPGSPFLKLPHN